MSDRQSRSGFHWIWVGILGFNILRSVSRLDNGAEAYVFFGLLAVAVLAALAALAFARARWTSNRSRRTTAARPVHLDPLWDDQLDRYPR
jgi:hypothetical protein